MDPESIPAQKEGVGLYKNILLVLLFAFALFAEEPWGMILGYHRIVKKKKFNPDVTAASFEAQLQFLKANYRVISLEELVRHIKEKIPLEANSVVITLDDGDESIYKNAYPILKKEKLPATVFLYSNYPGWGGISWNQVKEMSDNGISFGSHTKSHAILNSKNKGESEEKYLGRLRAELVDSKKIIEEKTGKEVVYLAYPFGKHNEVVDAEVLKAGYLAATGTAWDRNYVSTASPVNLKRRIIPGKYKLTEFVDIFKKTDVDKSAETQHEDY